MSLNLQLEKNGFWIILAVLILVLSVGWLGLGMFPDDPSPLDWSWKLALHYFFLNKKVFGQEVIFPLGPYGFLYSKTYFPGTYFLTATIWIILSLIFGWSSFWIVYKTLNQTTKLIATVVSAIWVLGLLFCVQGSLPDTFFMSFSVFLLTCYFYIDERKTSYLSILLTVTLTFIGLIKFSFTGTLLAVIFLITITDLLNKKKPTLLMVFFLAFPLFWLLARQPLQAIPSFIVNGLTVAQYYSELAFGGTFNEILLVVCTIILVILPVIVNEWKKRNLINILPVIGYLGICQMAFKAGYTRIDEFHVFTTNKILIVVALTYLLICFYENVNFYIKCFNIIGLLATIVLFSCNLNWYGKTTLLKYLSSALSVLPNNVSFSYSTFTGKINIQELYNEKMAKVRQDNPITHVDGTVDLYSFRQNILLAHNLAYQPRPVFQSNMATPYRVAKINAEYLKSKQAAQYIFFNNEVIDNRFPSIEDSLSWLELLTLYDIKSFDPKNQLLLLALSNNPRSYSSSSSLTQEISFNQEIDMSGLSKKLVWAEIHIRPTLAGKMVSAFWRTPIVYLRITLKNNQQYLYYLPREMGKTGFLLSPLISNNMDFAKLASKNSEVELSENVVKSFAILIENSAPDSWAFEPNILLSFSFLDFPKQDLGDLLTEIKQEEEKTKKRSEVNSLIQLSLTQIQQQDFVGAIISCEKAVKLEPTNNIAYNNLGFSYTKLLLFDKAINAFNKAIEISPEFVLAKNNLLDAKLSQNTTVDSNQLINNYMALTLSYINNNMFDEAITSCEAILKINPNHAISYNNICVAYNGLRLWDKAIIAAQKAIAIDPNFQLAKNNLAWAKSQKEQANLSK